MEHRTYRQAGDVVVELTGEVGPDESELLRSVLDAAWTPDGGRLVLDVAGLNYLTSAAVGVVAGMQRRLNGVGQRLLVRRPTPGILRLLRVTRLDTVLDVELPGGDA